MTRLSIIFLFSLTILPSFAFWFSDPRVDPHEEVTDECLRQAAWGRCEFYECLERRFPCGHRGYAVHVGLHFCRKIIDMMDEFTADGYRWMNRTSVCLTNALLPVYQSYATRCGDIKDEGVDSIVTCNSRVDPDGQDFCSFVQDNSDVYQDIFGIDEIKRMARLRSPRVLTRMIVDGASCGASVLEDRFYALTGSFNDMVGSLLENLDELRERWNALWN